MAAYFYTNSIKPLGSKLFSRAAQIAQNHTGKITLGIDLSLAMYDTGGNVRCLVASIGLGSYYFLHGTTSYVRKAGLLTATIGPLVIHQGWETKWGNQIRSAIGDYLLGFWGFGLS